MNVHIVEQSPLSGVEYRQRRAFSDPSLLSCESPHHEGSLRKLSHDVQHAASETYLVTRLALTLLRLLGYESSFTFFQMHSHTTVVSPQPPFKYSVI